jgi:hypothetical protein
MRNQKNPKLPQQAWDRRVSFLIMLTWVHAVAIAISALTRGTGHLPSEALIVAACGALATWSKESRTMQAAAVALGLLMSSAVLVHLSPGNIELQFHFFGMLVLLALLESWTPCLVAVGFVAAAAIHAPWTSAALHAVFVVWACLGSLMAWKFQDQVRQALLQATASR